MISIAKQRARIRVAFEECRHAYAPYVRSWNDLLDAARNAATEGERRHRRGTGARQWHLSAEDAARYFAVKWFLEVHKRPKSWAETCAIRDDARLAMGAADCTPKATLLRLRQEFRDVLGYDYSEWSK